jgi:hypothetical protein
MASSILLGLIATLHSAYMLKSAWSLLALWSCKIFLGLLMKPNATGGKFYYKLQRFMVHVLSVGSLLDDCDPGRRTEYEACLGKIQARLDMYTVEQLSGRARPKSSVPIARRVLDLDLEDRQVLSAGHKTLYLGL